MVLSFDSSVEVLFSNSCLGAAVESGLASEFELDTPSGFDGEDAC